MNAIWIVAITAAVLKIGAITGAHEPLRRRWDAWRHPKPSNDWCSVCHKDLPRGRIWEVRTDYEDFVDGPGGGTFLATTYCRRHRPRGAIRVD